ncbi:MAG: polysaccharide deacetylase family protein [Sphingobacteriaceae bacterium]|nr:polysaccharide deacetylase family protein [Cytophagaceae bacterium]
MFLHKAILPLRALYPDFIWRMPASEETIYLTFDDGPIPDVTEWVLEQLDAFGAKATFFCIGDNVVKNPSVFEKVRAGGHTVGNHTFNHLNGWKTDEATYLTNFEECQRVLPDTTLFRPPYGRITRPQARTVRRTHRVVMWDVLSGDFSTELSPEVVLQKTLKHSKPGSIVLFHDSLKARRTMQYALPRVLSHFSERGFRFKAIPSS